MILNVRTPMLYSYSSMIESEIWCNSSSSSAIFFSHDDFGYLESFVVPYEFEKVFSYCVKNIIKILMEIVLNQ